EGLLEAPGLVAGIRRLAVIDPAGGNQPIANEDGTVEVVFNGEIYNFVELREQLEAKGHRFATRSDTEVLVHLWEEHGPELVQRLNGMFAFCIHDRRQRRTFLARDRLGIKPLYWVAQEDKVVFASELAVLLDHPDVRAEVNPEALVEMFCLQYVSGSRTLYREVREVRPGAFVDIRDGRLNHQSWWELPQNEGSADAPRDAGSRAQELRQLLASAVAYRTVSDVPLGMFLSGGLDSSIICALLAQHSNRPVQTFSVGFDGQPAFDEREHARAVAGAFGAEHHELVVSAVQIAEHLPQLIAHLRAPVMDPALLPTWVLSRFA
ncbi:MAG: asparagine synthase (glutamine-hydrolyzing), partial [Acidobacteria bacterium]|nr:asparagine synthase (glutamine-hydrolyzing) [Acidobacteriota bacterium]NIO59671.1 asparagine synthase (glutamine-hydrolyzing) [Acidobacteriota bacterium]NIQ30765.1 asparagine synthase (glutamine-hydrolyzing) [Acidobacteriota bacterium]NIQ85782.1 asparagine synthase (glutamine-hydrolyzing) [Acidobacteriota bacterium]